MAFLYVSIFGVVSVAFALMVYNFVDLKAHDEGTVEMIERAAIIRSGAKTFLRREYRVIVPAVLIIAVAYSLFREAGAGVSFILGAVMSATAVEIGMRGGTYGNVRTTNAAKETGAMSRTIRIALMGGSISGFAVPAFGLFGFLIVWIASGGPSGAIGYSLIGHNPCAIATIRLTTYSLGCSVVAMFNRVAGGNYTKSADIAADNVGKNNHNLAEDDPRNVCSIADLIGDCVNDIAGNISDLLESLVATPTACILIAMQVFTGDDKLLLATCVYPMILIAAGLLSTLVGVMFIVLKNRKRHKWVEMRTADYVAKYPDKSTRPAAISLGSGRVRVLIVYSLDVEDPGAELNLATWMSAIVVAGMGLYGANMVFGSIDTTEFRLGWISPWIAALLGIISSVAVGMITEYYTSTKYRHVKELANMAPEGVAYMVTKGTAIGNRSVLAAVVVIGVSMLISGKLCGSYGVAIAAVGMLSFVGTTVSIDAFGPIADNAGGIAEGCGLDENVRKITDELDAVGNTTAAIGKGNAIGSAAFAVVALIISYIGSYPMPDYTDPNVIISVIVGGIFGMGIIKYFIGMLGNNTINASKKLALEAERQLAIPGVMEGKVKPDYNKAIEIAADNALRYMLVPSILSLLSPIVLGFPFGPEVVLGMLAGMAFTAIGEAIFNGNAGGARDNAKKAIEMGLVPGCTKGSEAHKAAVANDTVGDTEKDVIGVCCDISMKSATTVANSMAMLFHNYRIF
ncbi:sodium/proton-translocating pyrophosphatase [Candidatus Saccharibacteria bacterium]|nr:sodium/proton-translocating pyrophosphatase [Candidatus Saccharibacteria bacterium]